MPELTEVGVAVIINVVCFNDTCKFTIVIVSIHNIAKNVITPINKNILSDFYHVFSRAVHPTIMSYRGAVCSACFNKIKPDLPSKPNPQKARGQVSH